MYLRPLFLCTCLTGIWNEGQQEQSLPKSALHPAMFVSRKVITTLPKLSLCGTLKRYRRAFPKDCRPKMTGISVVVLIETGENVHVHVIVTLGRLLVEHDIVHESGHCLARLSLGMLSDKHRHRT